MLSKIVTIFALFSLLFVMYGMLVNIQKIEENKCKMTYMFEYPQFVKIFSAEDVKFPVYGLYAYSEGRHTIDVRNMNFNGAPIIFIHGNGGSFKQVRSLASVALRKGIDNEWKQHLDYFSVDLNEQYSGLYGGILNQQVDYVALCVRTILSLYKRHTSGPSSVMLVGHSLGGKIAQAVAVTSGTAPLINAIIAISSPIDTPVLMLDHYYRYFYNSVHEKWIQNRTILKSSYHSPKRPLDHILFVTIGGGLRDTMVHDALTDSVFSDLHAMTYNIPNVWLSTDHLCAVWCLQFVLMMNKFLYSLIQSESTSTNRFIENKDTRMRQGLHYFKYGKFIHEKILHNNIETEEWVEDIRRSYQYRFDEGLSKTLVQMIPLNKNSLYANLKVEVMNVNTNDWLFGCAAFEMDTNMRYCSTASYLSNHTYVLPFHENQRQIAHLNLHQIKENNPTWTHILLKFPKTKKPTRFVVDITDSSDRLLSIQMPRWFSFTNFQLQDVTSFGSTYYKLNVHGLTYSYQALAINVDVVSCSIYNPSVIAYFQLPWDDKFNRYSVHYYHQSFSVMMARIVQHFGHWIPAHCVAIILLSLKHQISVTPNSKWFGCGKFHSALIKSTPIFAITASRVFAKLTLMFKVLPQPEYFDSPILISIIIHGAALAILLILTGVIWAVIAFCGNVIHKLILRIVSLPIPSLSSTVVSCIQKVPIIFGVISVLVSMVSCGCVALVLANVIYFILLTKMYEEYLEHFVFKTAQRIAQKIFGIRIQPKRKKPVPENDDSHKNDSGNTDDIAEIPGEENKKLHDGLVNINFHLPLFLLLVIASLLNFPSFITWAKTYRYVPSLVPDASLIPSIIIVGCLSILWQIDAPRTIHGYNFLAGVLYTAAIVCILYCQSSIYRLNFVISGIIAIVTIHQLIGRTKDYTVKTE
ncbi:GPI inositol-deacylase isoform X2 [Toxorhynchites rutilus septentrionalis]|uniref:GPI inositol-deacylase isoform X2 n=1 Tax=Toxorhynchites rutilus septentrionalis TaxID=329112 RepID=UPI0024793165|nr:GPI inositol-deacylase isoform X2 [Toxorhynchites rutilus septentrionalis]